MPFWGPLSIWVMLWACALTCSKAGVAECDTRLWLQPGDWGDCSDQWSCVWVLCSHFAAQQPGSRDSGDKATVPRPRQQDSYLSWFIQRQLRCVFQAVIHSWLQHRHNALGLIAPWQAGPGLATGVNNPPRWHNSTLRKDLPQVCLSFLTSCTSTSHPCNHSFKPPFLSSWGAEVWIARGSQSARATSVCQKYNLFYCPNEWNENINSIKTQISVNKALAASHNCQTFRISLPMNECSLRSRNSRQPCRDLSGRLSCCAGSYCWRASCLLHRYTSTTSSPLYFWEKTACHQLFRVITNPPQGLPTSHLTPTFRFTHLRKGHGTAPEFLFAGI